ncbi:MAG: hypothetical protein ABIP06_13005 [Pyrinomonadaceae bacterium]
MKKVFCQKCGGEISNEFGVTLAFCTNCGTALNNLNEEETVVLTRVKKPKNNLFVGLGLGILTILFLVSGVYLAYNYLQKNDVGSSGRPDSTSSPWIRIPKFGSVSAAEITEITFYSWQHNGLLYSGDGYIASSRVTFSRGGNASQIKKKDFDNGKTPDEINEKTGNISLEQFERMAKKLVEKDFFNQTDSTERISEGDNSITVKFSGKEKEVKTSNVGKDTPEIKAVLDEITNLESRINWQTAK